MHLGVRENPGECAGCGAATRQLPTYANFYAIETHSQRVASPSLSFAQCLNNSVCVCVCVWEPVGVCARVCVRMRMQNPGNVAQFARQKDPKRLVSTRGQRIKVISKLLFKLEM